LVSERRLELPRDNVSLGPQPAGLICLSLNPEARGERQDVSTPPRAPSRMLHSRFEVPTRVPAGNTRIGLLARRPAGPTQPIQREIRYGSRQNQAGCGRTKLPLVFPRVTHQIRPRDAPNILRWPLNGLRSFPVAKERPRNSPAGIPRRQQSPNIRSWPARSLAAAVDGNPTTDRLATQYGVALRELHGSHFEAGADAYSGLLFDLTTRCDEHPQRMI